MASRCTRRRRIPAAPSLSPVSNVPHRRVRWLTRQSRRFGMGTCGRGRGAVGADRWASRPRTTSQDVPGIDDAGGGHHDALIDGVRRSGSPTSACLRTAIRGRIASGNPRFSGPLMANSGRCHHRSRRSNRHISPDGTADVVAVRPPGEPDLVARWRDDRELNRPNPNVLWPRKRSTATRIIRLSPAEVRPCR
jgi:hypothetical protein